MITIYLFNLKNLKFDQEFIKFNFIHQRLKTHSKNNNKNLN